MELMATCLDKLMKRLKEAIPEKILGKVAVAVSLLDSFTISMYHCQDPPIIFI